MQKMNNEQLKNYFLGNCTEEEEGKVKQWIIQNSDSPAFLDAMTLLWDEVPEIRDIEKAQDAYARFVYSLDNKYESLVVSSEMKSNKQKLKRSILWLQRIAAVAVIPLIMFAAYYYNESRQPKNWVEEYVHYADKKHIRLSDNSSVCLTPAVRLYIRKNLIVRKGKYSSQEKCMLTLLKTLPNHFIYRLKILI